MFSKLLVLFTLALSVSSLTTPHAARSPVDHHALAARIAAPAPGVGPYGDAVTVVKPKRMRRKRGDTDRCRAKSTSAEPSSTTTTTSTSSSVFSSSAKASSTKAASTPVANIASFTAETPDTTWTPKPSSSKSSTQAAQTTAASSSNSGLYWLTGKQDGQATFYAIGMGACGVTNGGNDRIAAVSLKLFDNYPGYDGANPNQNPVCGKSVTVSYKGKSTTVQIQDRCEACDTTDLDLSPTAFSDIADQSLGRLDGMTWTWN